MWQNEGVMQPYNKFDNELNRCDYCNSNTGDMGYTNSTWLCDPVSGYRPEHLTCLACYDSAQPPANGTWPGNSGREETTKAIAKMHKGDWLVLLLSALTTGLVEAAEAQDVLLCRQIIRQR